jgi:DHA1 family tetracycline resistance protein-like MFS transporter
MIHADADSAAEGPSSLVGPDGPETGRTRPSSSSPGPRPTRAALVFIFITVALDMLALGMIIPVLPKLVVDFVGGDMGRAALTYGLFVTVWESMQFLFSPLLGALSDRFGRRPVVLLSNFGLGADYLLMAMAPSLSLLLVGRAISGVTSASFSTAGAYIADVMPPERRAGAFGTLGAAFGLGFVVGPALGGLLGTLGPRVPFWVAASLSLANAMYGAFILPESLPLERRAPFAWRRANPVGALLLLSSRPELIGLAMVSFVANLAHFVLQSTFVLYAGYRYGWDERTVGLSLALVGVCASIVQGGLVRHVVARLGERPTLLVGLLFGASGFATYGLAPTSAFFWLGIPLNALWGLAGPAAQGLMSRQVGPSEQGQLQGALASLAAIAGIFGPTMFTAAFARGIEPSSRIHLPGAPFLLAASLLLVAAVLAERATRRPRLA